WHGLLRLRRLRKGDVPMVMKFTMLLAATTVAAFAMAPVAYAKSGPGPLPSAAQQGYGNSGGEVVWWRTAPRFDTTASTDVLNTPNKFPRRQVDECRTGQHR